MRAVSGYLDFVFMGSYNAGKNEINEWIRGHIAKGSECLDIGAGDGRYSDMLRDWLIMDAIEAFEPNAQKIREKYRNVINADARGLKYKRYDLVLLCDVLEHMSKSDAQNVLRYAISKSKEVIVALPFQYRQDAIYGNKYEIHIQDDLTEQLVAVRYPELELLFKPIPNYAYYRALK